MSSRSALSFHWPMAKWMPMDNNGSGWVPYSEKCKWNETLSHDRKTKTQQFPTSLKMSTSFCCDVANSTHQHGGANMTHSSRNHQNSFHWHCWQAQPLRKLGYHDLMFVYIDMYNRYPAVYIYICIQHSHVTHSVRTCEQMYVHIRQTTFCFCLAQTNGIA